ncbi:MAG: hypothetical protein WAU01_06840, partial [Saprospiraceae bacterium]
GELQFAPTEIAPSEFAPTEIAPTEFAPTEIAPTKIASTNNAPKFSGSIWQRDFYEIIIRDEQAYHNISKYIINNPSKWQTDKLNKR